MVSATPAASHRHYAPQLLSLAALAGLVGTAMVLVAPETSPLRRRLQQDYMKNQQRPVIHTFYSPLSEDAFVTGMSETGDEALLEEWKRSWWEAGYEPRILTIEDAKTHPYFIPIDYALQHTWLDGYNKMCIFRWVAMSNVGGGWMSDYDVVPIRSFDMYPLPNRGTMTVHDNFVPALVSGNAEEYIRIAQEIVQVLLEKDAEKKEEADSYNEKKRARRIYTLFTDMFFLQKNQDRYMQDKMIMYKTFFNRDEALGAPWTPEKCEERTPESVKAIHFSHDAIKNGEKNNLLHEGQGMDSRAEIAREWVAAWKKSCDS